MNAVAIPYLQAGRLHLRPLEPEDLELLYQWENDTTLWGYSGATVPYSRYLLKQYIESATSDIYQDRQLRLMIDDREENTTVGIIDLYDFDPSNARAGVGILIAPTMQQRGYATEALTLLVQYAFTHLQLHQLYAHVAATNLPSNRLFSHIKFTPTATLKQWCKTPQGYVDIVVYQLFNK